MKKSQLVKMMKSGIMLLMVFLASFQLQAQTDYLSPVTGVVYGTSDSRLTATVKQSGNQVTMTVGAVGVIIADVFEFNVLFNPDSLKVTDSLFSPITDIGSASKYPSIFGAIRIEPAVRDLQFTVSQSTAIRDNGNYSSGGTGHSVMHSIDAHIFNGETTEPTKIVVDSAEFVPLFTIFFEKADAELLDPDAIGFNIRTALGMIRSIRWVYEGASISYDRTLSDEGEEINPNLFSFRSPSSVQTKTVTDVAENLAVFNGSFKRGEIPPAYNLLDSVANTPRYTGKMLNDTIVRYGFFYTESNLDISFTEYSDSITVNGVLYPFPTIAMINQGSFAAGNDTIQIVVTGNASSAREEDYTDTVTGLKPNSTYNMWAFAQYVFETSKPYPIIGAKQTFTTSQILNIASSFSATDPNCGQDDGKIQFYVIGGSGSFQYSLDGENYLPYTDGLISNLGAGSYRIYVRDAYDTLYPAAVSHEIVLRDAGSSLAVSVAATPATDCLSQDGILHISVDGGSGSYAYTWADGSTANVANGQIAGLPAGVYVLNVSDNASNGCAASSGEIRIESNTTNLQLAVDSVSNADCGQSTGIVYFTVTGSDYYKYQLDGMSVMTATTNNQIVVSGLNAGEHSLRVFDTCGNEVSQNVFIYNVDQQGFAVTAEAFDVSVACDNFVTKGKIVLTASNGMHDYQYTIDGITWKNFAAGKDTVTLSDLSEGVYYVQVKDSEECTYEITTIAIKRETATPLNVLAGYTSTDPSCNNADGSIQIHATGGSGNYTYSYSTDAGVTFTNVASSNGLIANLGAGSYRVKVQDANSLSCAAAQSGEIVLHNSGTDLDVAVVAVDASSCDVNVKDGQLYVSVSGGSGNYSYTLNGTAVNPVNGIIDNLSAGIYILNVKDNADNCTATSGEVRISSSASQLAVNITEESTTVCGLSVGTATFVVTSTSNYSYQVDGRAIVSVNHNNPIVVSGLNAGVHTLRVFDACAEVTEQIIITNGGSGLQFAIAVENEKIACDNSLISGKIVLTAANGTYDYRYSTDGTTWTTFAAGKDTTTISDLSNGIYYVQVKDTTGCTYEWNSIVIERERLPLINIGTIYAAKDPTSCSSKDGEIQVYATGGSGAYQYSLDGITYTNYANGLITGLEAGTYRIYVRDANYATCAPAVSDDVILNNSSSTLFVSVSADPATTCSTPDGVLYVTVSGGSGNYSYLLNGTAVSPVNGIINNLSANVYVLEVIDGSCVASSGEVRINSPAFDLGLTVNDITHTVCESSVGAVKFTVSGASVYNYQLDGMPVVAMTNNNPVTLGGLSAGVHTLRIFNDCGEISEQIIITNGAGGLAFTAEVENFGCATTPQDRSIILTVTGGTAPYQYSLNNGSTWSSPTSAATIVITDLLAGTYNVMLKDDANCQYEYTQIRIDENGLITPPSATTPQTFCDNATVANLQATGTGIKWYATPHGGIALSPNTVLDSGKVYYAAQSIGTCESKERTAVKVIINNNIIIDAPSLAYDQAFCVPVSGTLTLADIATDGNTNIVWYDNVVGGNILPITTPLADNTSYFAALTAAGGCQSVTRAEVFVTFTTDAPDTVRIVSPQTFCKGALIADIAVPHNQIVWYTAAVGGDMLTAETVLRDGVTYYAAYKAGGCESTKRTAVTIQLTSPIAPTLPSVQTTCGGYKQTLADLTVTGSGIVWYDSPNSTTPLSPTTSLVVGATYYAAQSSTLCEGDRAAVKITDECFTLKGTVFPFVHTDVQSFDEQFPVVVKLYPYPASMDCDDPLAIIYNGTPIVTTIAKHHDGSEWIPNTPKYPGTIGMYNNPGLPINWGQIGKTAGTPDNRLLTQGDNTPVITVPGASIGWYELTNVPPADYLLVISRQGFMTRIGKVSVIDNASLGHRELVPGDVNTDFMVNPSDASAVKARYSSNGQPIYNAKYDMNGDAEINGYDLEYVKTNNSATFRIYEETEEWLFDECE